MSTLTKFLQKRWQILAVLFLASFLIFFRINHTDIIGDDGHYSFRAIGLVDFLMADPQSTPVQWYQRLPWWTYLSFHDHPPVLFIVQNIFLQMSRTAFFAKLPYALFALGSIALTYAWVGKLYGKRTAVLSILLMTLAADFIALARRPLMEAGVIFFITLALYYFVVFLEDRRVWWKLGIALGLLLEVKLTTLFIFPALATYLWLNPVWRNNPEIRRRLRHIFLIVALMALPVIIYNAMMYFDRGHFSYQFARLLHQDSPWKAGGVAVFNPIGGAFTLIKSLAHWFSIPYAVAAVGGVLFGLSYARKKMLFPLILLGWFFLEDILIGAKDLYVIFLPVIMAIAAVALYDRLRKPSSKNLARISAAVLCIYLLVYVINSNLLPLSFGSVAWLRMSSQPTNYGLSQLDNYLEEFIPQVLENGDVDVFEVFPDVKANFPLAKLLAPTSKTLENDTLRNIILYDDNISWFARFWIFGRRLMYDNVMVISTKTLPGIIKNLGDTPRISYFIKASPHTLLDGDRYRGDLGQKIEQELIARGEVPIKIIYRDDGKEAFRVYKIRQGIELDVD